MSGPFASTGSWSAWLPEGQRLRLGASACLLGDEVRYDGGHKRSRFLTDHLGAWVEWVRVCPEVEVGLGVPRPTLRLEQQEQGTRLVETKTRTDHTDAMEAFSRARAQAIADADLDGFVLKKDSPSCGLFRVKSYRANGSGADKSGVGVFAEALSKAAPRLPLEEEGRLNDADLREHFVTRIFAAGRWRAFSGGAPRRGDLVEFHRAHKFLVLAHDESTYRRMGRAVSSFGERPDAEVFEEYGLLLHQALSKRASRGRHANVMHHLAGHLKDRLDSTGRRALERKIDEYRTGATTLDVPRELLRFLAEVHGIDYLLGQLYLDPHPRAAIVPNATGALPERAGNEGEPGEDEPRTPELDDEPQVTP